MTETISVDINRCIYCGSINDLNNEHAVPFGMSGKWLLRKASCPDCKKVVDQFERDVMRNIMRSARATVQTRTRHKHPGTVPIQVKRDGINSFEEVSIKDLGGVLSLLEYRLPAYIDKRLYTKGIDVIASCLVSNNKDAFKTLGKQLKATTLSFPTVYKGHNFERFISKIAYSMAVFEFGTDVFEDFFILPSILDKKDDIGMWFGSLPPTKGSNDVEVSFKIIEQVMYCQVRLFGTWEVPTYIVVLGRTMKDLARFS